uniref:Neuroglian n=1 Tax=Syphacia muris TaxID=451379 RepID=A0A0N5AT71_9BILA
MNADMPIPEPTWYHNGVVIPYNDGKSGYYTFENYGKSILFNVTWESGGLYECRFNQHSGLDRKFNVTVKSKPFWIDGPPNAVNTSEDEEAVIRCKAGGLPPPSIEFLKNGVLIKPNSHMVIEEDTLTIKNVKKSKNIGDDGDDAVYQCRATNEYGFLWENIPLRIFAMPPMLQSDSGTVSVVKNKSAFLKCKFAASPKVTFTWKGPSSDKIISEGSRQDAPNEGIIEIKDVSENDAGEYTCVAKNKYGTANSTVSLIVREPTVIAPLSETLRSVVAGKDIYIPCNATHDENLQVVYEWYMNDNFLREDLLKSGHYLIDGNHGLHIKNPTRNDAARYDCIARTELDEANSSISIDVKDVPKAVHQVVLTCSPGNAKVSFTYFENESGNTSVNEFWVQYRIGNGTFDEAAWQTYPLAVFADSLKNIGNEQKKYEGTASVDLKPFGNYQFRVFGRNNVGDGVPVMANGTCQTASSIPTRNPSNVAVKIISRDQIKVSWDPLPREDWNGEDFHYVVRQRKKDGADEWNETVIEDPFQNYVILNIPDAADAGHEIQVGVKNKEGSPQVSPQSIDIIPSEGDLMHVVPSNFRIVELGSTSVKFEWDPVTSIASNNNLVKIKITCKPLRDDDELNGDTGFSADSQSRNKRHIYQTFRRKRNAICGEEYDDSPHTVVVSLNETKYTVEGFCPDTKYKAQIALSNGETDGDSSEITFTTLKGVPSQVQNLEASAVNYIEKEERGVVVVSWNHPKRSKEADMEYIVEICKIQQNNAVARDSCPTTKTKERTLRLTDLDFDTHYRVIATGVTSVGKGDPNSCDVRTVPEVVNSELPPVKPSVSAEANENSIEYKVTPGVVDDNRPVGNVFYTEYREEGSDEWKKTDNLVSDLRGHLSGLEAGTNYDLHSVAAYVDERGNEVKTVSPDMKVRTAGAARASAKLWLLLLIVLIILLVFCILCVICVAARRRGAKYPVSEKERQQGRIPILSDDKERGFGEYIKPEDDEKRSLTGGSKAESETDSMAEYGDSDPGRFTEDGSFIGQYVPNKTLVSTSATGRPDRESASTFV